MLKVPSMREFLHSEWEFLRTDPIAFVMSEVQTWAVAGVVLFAICAAFSFKV